MRPPPGDQPSGSRFPPWLVAPATLTLLLAFVALAGSVTPFPARSWLRHLGVPAQDRMFGDLRAIADAIDATRDGGSPYMPPVPGGPQPAFNYPEIWLLLRYAGLNGATIVPWGCALGVIFLATVFRVVRPATTAEGAYLALLVCSPPCLLALERGNSDLIVFIALAWSVVLVPSAGLGVAAILVAGCAKLFPIGAIAALRPSLSLSRWLVLTAIVVAVFLVWLWATRDEWAAVLAVTPRIPHWNFGAAVAGQWVREFTALEVPRAVGHGMSLAAAAAVLLWLGAVARQERAHPLPWTTESGCGLLLGLGVVGLAWAMGNSFQYRLVFLFACVPALWHARNAQSKPTRAAARCALITLPVYLWWDFFAGERQLGSALSKQFACFVLLGSLTLLGLRAFRAAPAPCDSS